MSDETTTDTDEPNTDAGGSPRAEPFVKGEDDGTAYHALGALALVKATSEETGGAFGVVERRGGTGLRTPLHVHHSTDELWYVLDGRVELSVERELLRAGPGDTVFAPRGVPHAFRVAADDTRYLLFQTPGDEAFFADIGTRVADATVPEAGPSDDELARLESVAATYDAEILGPPPFEE